MKLNAAKKGSRLLKVLVGLACAVAMVSAPAPALASTSAYSPMSGTGHTQRVDIPYGTPGYSFIDSSLRGRYFIKSELGNLYLDMDCAHRGNCGNAQLWHYNGTNAQKWLLLNCGNGIYKIMNYNSGRVLSIANNCRNAGTQVWQYDDWSSDYQKWWAYRYKDYNGHVTYQFVNVATGQSLDVRGGVARAGTRVQQWPGNWTPAQKWTLSRAY